MKSYKLSFTILLFICLLICSCKTQIRNYHVVLKTDSNIKATSLDTEILVLKNRLVKIGCVNITVQQDKSNQINLKFSYADTSASGLKMLLMTQGHLAFYETFRFMDIVPYLLRADSSLHTIYAKSLADTALHPLFNRLDRKSVV